MKNSYRKIRRAYENVNLDGKRLIDKEIIVKGPHHTKCSETHRSGPAVPKILVTVIICAGVFLPGGTMPPVCIQFFTLTYLLSRTG